MNPKISIITITFNSERTPIVLVLIGAGKKTITLPEIGAPLILFFMILHLLDFIVPVIFMRFLMYLDIVYICALSDFVIDFPKKYIGRKTYLLRNMVTVFLLFIALYRPVTTFFRVNPLRDELPFYRQFYPYHSVFNPKIDPQRAVYYGYYNDKDTYY